MELYLDQILTEQGNQIKLIEIRQPVSNFSSNKEFFDFRNDQISKSINPWLAEVYQNRAIDMCIPISIWALVAVKINDGDETISRLLDYQEFDDSTASLDETMSFMEWVEIFNPTSWGDWLMVPSLFSNYLVTGKNLLELVATPDPWIDGLLRESRGRLIWKTQLSEIARVIGNNYEQIRTSFMMKNPGWEKPLANIVYPQTKQTLLSILEERTWNMQIFGAPDYILSNWLSIHSDQK